MPSVANTRTKLQMKRSLNAQTVTRSEIVGCLGHIHVLTRGIFLFTGAHPASYPMGTRGSFIGVKRPGREVYHSPPSSAEVKECVELYLHSPKTPSWRGAELNTGTTLPLHLLHYLLGSMTRRGKEFSIFQHVCNDSEVLFLTRGIICRSLNLTANSHLVLRH
jgi:hypothetical protein